MFSQASHTGAQAQIPRGVADYFWDEAFARRRLEAALLDLFRAWGYQDVIPPMFEYADTFLHRSSPKLQAELYRFLDRDGSVLASTPDLIMLFDADSGEPITTESLRYGFRVSVLGAPCDPRWRTPEGLALVGPHYFGYDVDYVPVEELAGHARP